MGDDPNKHKAQVISGEYVLVPNPCTTKPCLPGMAFALRTADGLVFVAVGGSWFSESLSWGSYTPRDGDRVTVTGEVHTRVDVDGEPFQVIEARDLDRG